MITVDMIMALEPCWTRERVEGIFGKRKSMHLRTLLKDKRVPAEDRLWVALREDFMWARDLRIFACDCADRALSRVKYPDPRSVGAVRVARLYADGKATGDELTAAWYAARDAARSAAGYAAGYAARDAAGYAARYAGRSAAGYAARYAARSAERDWQIQRLMEAL
jgi:hypothetical protein